MDPETIALDLKQSVDGGAARLRALGEAEASRPRQPGKWSAKEVVGHLIDSASNNTQRFVRAVTQGQLVFPGYDQVAWVRAQGYADAPWTELVDLWRLLNVRLAQTIRRIPADRVQTQCRIGDREAAAEPVTLGWLAQDYVRHLRHHLEQISSAV